VSCLKNNIRIYIKIYIKIAPTCFGVTVTQINALPDDGVTVNTETCRSCFNVNFNVNFNIVFKTTH